MSNKLRVTKKQMASLGLKKSEQNGYEYINPEDESKYEYKPVRNRKSKV
ncbi:hypothetical protein SAMN02745163_02834 [Clostridium cavendishii DSM 21758]|uniref:Uncharacterized protein n=1 Tax=Clostridium cavendishii DSM 21758 TaxID=1121302 RepID=A0A1M6N9X7_9CLOT|nr:hypothetical protein [Clostridium cavendishii]SHJ92356.1 hypothetical protein SAMN02745163_02834 [Clostridium cavendishii DSM 21758]